MGGAVGTWREPDGQDPLAVFGQGVLLAGRGDKAGASAAYQRVIQSGQ
jgi:hypothetical protein